MVGLVLSITVGLFGVDRFYKGDILLACIKLAFFIIPLFATFAAFIALLDESHSIFIDYFAIFALMFVVASIWKLVDIYLVFVGIKKDNFHKILNFFCRRKNKMSQKKNKMSYFCDKLSFFQP
ncbi:TM2 domain-containing protein [Campylobacter coli]|nr:TM2 domain-containing protein [Campylobacter coli]